MRSVLAQVTFQFGLALEARYLEKPPELGEHVRASNGETWVVSEVVGEEHDYDLDEHEYHLVVCAPLPQPSK
jgi:hypothetical protein